MHDCLNLDEGLLVVIYRMLISILFLVLHCDHASLICSRLLVCQHHLTHSIKFSRAQCSLKQMYPDSTLSYVIMYVHDDQIIHICFHVFIEVGGALILEDIPCCQPLEEELLMVLVHYKSVIGQSTSLRQTKSCTSPCIHISIMSLVLMVLSISLT